MSFEPIVADSPWSRWALALMALALVLSQGAVVLELVRSGARGRAAALLRVLAVALTLVVLVQLGRVEREETHEAGRIAILVDDSASMRAASRLPRALTYLAREQQRLLGTKDAETPHISWHGLHRASEGPPQLEDAVGSDTDLLGALVRVHEREGDGLRAILLASDGADLHLAAPRKAMAPHLGEAERALLKRLNVPVSTLAVGEQDRAAGCEIVDVKFDGRGYVKSAQQIEIDVACEGVAKTTREVALCAGTRELLRGDVEIADSRKALQQARITLMLRPEERGPTGYEVVLLASQQDAQTAFEKVSRFAFIVDAARERTRVLHVAGQPSVDVRFLRQALRQQHHVELVSFYILRGLHSDMSVPERDMALIPFPVEQLFTSELKNFDVVVLQNFDARPFGMTRYMPQLAHAIAQEGVGLLMLGGPQSLGSGGYDSGPLAELLPVRMRPDDYRSDAASVVWPQGAAKDTGLGRALGAGAIPPGLVLGGGHPSLALREGAQEILRARGKGGATSPLLAVARRNKGHVMVVASDELWRLKLSPSATAESQRGYERLWQEALGYLVGEADDAQLGLRVTPSTADLLGPTPTLNVVHRHADLSFAVGARVQTGVYTAAGAAVWQERLVTDAQGSAAATLPALPAGLYTVRAAPEGHPDAAAETPLAIRALGDELRRTRPRPELLAEISQASGGVVLRPEAAAQTLPRRPAAPGQLLGLTHNSLWDRPEVLVGLVALWLGAWALSPYGRRS